MERIYVKRYSQAFKLKVVREYESGASVRSLEQKYGIGGATTIKRWVKQFGRSGYRNEVVRIQSAADHEHVQAMKERIVALESALAQSTLDNRMLSATLAVASEELGIDLKKTFAPKSSNTSQAPKPLAGQKPAAGSESAGKHTTEP
jgi:transposase